MTDNPKLLSLLGMCRRAGKLSCGHDAAMGSIRSKSAKLCLLSSDSSQRLRNEIEREAAFGDRNIPVRMLNSTIDEIGNMPPNQTMILNKASEEGTRVHEAIERLCKTGEVEDIKEVKNFIFLQKCY